MRRRMFETCDFVDDDGRACTARAGHDVVDGVYIGQGSGPRPHTFRPSMVQTLELEARNMPMEVKESHVRDTFGISYLRYLQILNAFLETPAALEHDAPLVCRLIDQRERRITDRYQITHHPRTTNL